MDQIYYNRYGHTIYLNIYNVTPANSFLECLGFGLYHTSVGVYDSEISYGGHNKAHSGIVVMREGYTQLPLKESIPVGITYYSDTEIDSIVEYFGDFWHG